MSSNDFPPLVIGLCALLFFCLAVFYPWLSRALNAEQPRPERRALAVILGLMLVAIWSIWFVNRDI